jgi:CHAD domain-containing protein
VLSAPPRFALRRYAPGGNLPVMARPTEVPGLLPETPLAIAAPLLLRARLADVRCHEGAFGREHEPDPDVVHDMRVAARRLRAALDLLGRRALRDLEPNVKALQDALGALRDVQVQRAWLASDERGDGAARLAARVDAGRPRVEKELRRALRAWRAAVAPAIERSMPRTARNGRLGGKRIAREARRALRRLERRMDRAAERASPRRTHRLRIAAKKLRYLAELARPGSPEVLDHLLAELVPLQERLGELHDTDVRVARLGELASRGDAVEAELARGLLESVRTDRARQEHELEAELTRWRDEEVVPEIRAGLRNRNARRRAAAESAESAESARDARDAPDRQPGSVSSVPGKNPAAANPPT